MKSHGVAPTATDSNWAIYRRVWKDYVSKRWLGVAVSIAFAVLAGAANGAILFLLAHQVDLLLKTHGAGYAWLTVPAILGGLGVVRGVALIGQSTVINRIGHRVVSDIQIALVGNFMRGDLARLRSQHTGGFVSRILFDAGVVREAATSGVINYVQNVVTLIGVVFVMLWYDWVLSLAVLTIAPIVGWVLRDYSKRTTRAAKGVMEENSNLTTALMESLDGVRVVKMENKEGFEERRVADAIARRQKHIIAGADARAMAAPVSELMVTLMLAVVVCYAGWRFQMNETHIGPFVIAALTPGAFMSYVGALLMGSQSLRLVANLQTVMAEGAAAARRLFATLDIVPSIGDAAGAVALPPGEATVRLESVNFTYGAGVEVLDGLSLEARRGEIVALVGPSGAGKTTVLNLIPRFYDVSGGRLTVDGHDVREVTQASLRRQIALVTQEPFLFDDTIRANIAYAKDDATPAEIEAAARQAAAHDFITALPKGYDTLVGEAGARVSGGQRQRIAIARAFLKDAPILLLDEATSALDTESEAQVQLALERLMAGRTTIIIAHRLSTVRGADRIYVIDRGRVVEEGDHESLVRRRGLYARLAGSQDLERAPEAAE
ncbi:MAG TPA: ABC transporter ATP-binding protein [Caulobacteraceae bacterium]|nr:ABC transporter ATP-binding protein [Caulobacteraceae bacterium]